MNPSPAPWRSAVLSALSLLVGAVLLGTSVNLLRPSPLPWVGDWSHHVETLALRASVPVVYLPELKSLFASDSPPLFVDARSPAEFAVSRIPHAVSIPAPGTEDDFLALADTVQHDLSSPVVVYCSGLDCADALDVSKNLRDRGWSGVRLYPGGFSEWSRYGNPVEPGVLP